MVCGRKEGNIFLRQFDNFFKVWAEDGEVGFALCLDPGFECLGGGNGAFCHITRQAPAWLYRNRGQKHGSTPRRLKSGSVIFLFEIFEQPADCLRSGFFVGDPADGGELLATRFAAIGGHVNILVPIQYVLIWRRSATSPSSFLSCANFSDIKNSWVIYGGWKNSIYELIVS